MNKILTWGSVILGLLLVVIAVVYFVTPAGNLPSMMPGFIPGGTSMHLKHGIASLILGLAVFAFAWFQSAPAKTAPAESMNQ